MAIKLKKIGFREISRRSFFKDTGFIAGGATVASAGLLSRQAGATGVPVANPGSFVCPVCEQAADSLSEWQSHFRSKHENATTTPRLNIVKFKVNNQPYKLPVKPSQTLYEIIHDVLGFAGVKASCERGACGFCTVIVDGRPILSCMTLAMDCDGASIETIEGIAKEGHPIIESWIKYEGMQCGFCTSSAILTAKNLLDRNPVPTEDEIREALSGNLCRCVTYPAWTKAVLHASGQEV